MSEYSEVSIRLHRARAEHRRYRCGFALIFNSAPKTNVALKNGI